MPALCGWRGSDARRSWCRRCPLEEPYAGGVTDQTAGQGAESLEVERKYEAAIGLRLPGADAFAAAGFVAREPDVQRLSACYFDTSNGDVARGGFAVTKR